MNLKIKSCAGWIWDWLTWFPHLCGSFVQQTCSWMTPRPAWSPRPCLPPVSRCWHQWQQSPGLVISQTPRRISLPAQLNHPTKATPSHPSNLWKESLVGQWKWQLSHSCKWQVTERELVCSHLVSRALLESEDFVLPWKHSMWTLATGRHSLKESKE